jgi:predicted ester cyclase
MLLYQFQCSVSDIAEEDEMDVERNKATVRRVFEEGFNQGRLEVVDLCLAADAVDHHEQADGSFRDHLKAVITMLRAGMPDLTMTVEDLIAEGDRVAARVVLTGTHTGAPIAGIEARGHPVRVEQFHFVQCDGEGRGRAHWAAAGIDQLAGQLAGAAAAPV